ncbi:MAG: aldehyde dehydrogenase [Deltaproteobacteria bacterium]|jgi:aldehyde dehydrogenase (NAD+)|nr:aldehyde dehydrogenase [Deltaproteobacteria bacterium]
MQTRGEHGGRPDRFLNLIDGQLCEADSGDWLDSVDPSRGSVWAQIPASGSSDVDRAVEAAGRAFRRGSAWRSLPAAGRAALLRRVGDLVVARAEDLARLESRDNGKVIRETLPEVQAVAAMFHYWAGAADKIQGETIAVGSESFNYTLHEPLGVVGAILPWNAPLSLLAAKVGAILAAGNTLVVKPAEQAACSTLVFAPLFEEAGFPPGVVNVVAGLGPMAGDALVTHPGVAKITFTGENATAKTITARSAETLKRLAFELGGKSPNIVFADADLDAAARGVLSAVFTGNAGQTCICGSRTLIQRSVYDDFISRVEEVVKGIGLGDPLDPATGMGPLAFDGQFEKVKTYLDLGREEGAEIAFGGEAGGTLFEAGSPFADGYYVAPTMFRDARNDMRICREEIFGPVTAAIPFDDEEEAISIANDTHYGLAAGVWTNDLRRAHRMVAAVEAGMVWINNYRRIHWAVPFGGFKQSGYGRDSGLESLRGYQQTKSVWLDLADG